jgi:hypothetical protein
MEIHCKIFENGYPVSIDQLLGHEVLSLVDEIESIVSHQYSVLTDRHTDNLVIVHKDHGTLIPKEFLEKWVHPQIPWIIHPDNYGLSPRSRKWMTVTVRFVLPVDDSSQHTTSSEQVEVHLK